MSFNLTHSIFTNGFSTDSTTFTSFSEVRDLSDNLTSFSTLTYDMSYNSTETISSNGYYNINSGLKRLDDVERMICGGLMRCRTPEAWGNCSIKYPDLYHKIQLRRDLLGTIQTPSKVILSILYAVITMMSLVGNSLVIITFIFDKHMRSVTNVFILSLALADLMVTLTCVPINIGTAFTSDIWIFGSFACKLVPFSMTFSVACSSLTLCCIALDRYFAIVHPHKFKFLRNPMPAGICLVVIWGLSLLCSVPNAVFYTLRPMEPLCRKDDDTGEKQYFCVWPSNKYKLPLELWLTFVVLFIIPLMIMSTAYGLIGYQLWIRKPIGVKRRNSLRNADMKKSVIKMLVIVMLAYIVCWSPIMVFNAVEKMVKYVNLTQTTVRYLKFYFQCLSMTSCCINPVIYTFMNRKFRDKFVTYLCCRNNKVNAITHTVTKDMKTTDMETEKPSQRMSLSVIAPRSYSN